MVRNFHSSGPRIQETILEQNGILSYVVKIDSGMEWKLHVDHLQDVSIIEDPLIWINRSKLNLNQ